jgi:hypothetical protein
MKTQRNFNMTKESYSTSDILPLITFKDSLKHKKCNIDNDDIKVSSVRLLTFKIKGIKCVQCGIKGSFFRKEKHKNDVAYHLNLYAINEKGEEILMTKDHIMPKSFGGKNSIDNLQTMCIICNQEKGNKI